jgi:hypothetical protein
MLAALDHPGEASLALTSPRVKELPQGLKPRFYVAPAARLKSCPSRTRLRRHD